MRYFLLVLKPKGKVGSDFKKPPTLRDRVRLDQALAQSVLLLKYTYIIYCVIMLHCWIDLPRLVTCLPDLYLDDNINNFIGN